MVDTQTTYVVYKIKSDPPSKNNVQVTPMTVMLID